MLTKSIIRQITQSGESVLMTDYLAIAICFGVCRWSMKWFIVHIQTLASSLSDVSHVFMLSLNWLHFVFFIFLNYAVAPQMCCNCKCYFVQHVFTFKLGLHTLSKFIIGFHPVKLQFALLKIKRNKPCLTFIIREQFSKHNVCAERWK